MIKEALDMKFKQETYNFNGDVTVKFFNRDRKKVGSIVRNIIGYADEQSEVMEIVDIEEDESVSDNISPKDKALQFSKDNKNAFIIAGVGVGLAAVGLGLYLKKKNKKSKVICQLDEVLDLYVDSIEEGHLDIDIITDLMMCLEEIYALSYYDNINIDISPEDIIELLDQMYGYTEQLANDKNVSLTEDDREILINLNGDIQDLEKALLIQKRILEEGINEAEF